MRHHKSNGGKPLWGRWHDFRRRARRDAMSHEEFTEDEVVTFNLDGGEDNPYPGRITGEDNPRTYRVEDGDRDIRDDDNI